MKKISVKLFYFLIVLCSCNRKLLNQIKADEKLSSFATIVADSGFFSKNPYWLEEPKIQILYNSLFGLDYNSVLLRKGEECKIFISEPAVIWCQQINMPVVIYPGEKINIQLAELGNARFESINEKRAKELHSFTIVSELVKDLIRYELPADPYQPVQSASSVLQYDNTIALQLNKKEQFIKNEINSLVKANNISAKFQKVLTDYLSAKIFAVKTDYLWITKKYYAPPDESRFGELISCSNAIESHEELKYYYNSVRELAALIVNSRAQISRVIDTASMQLFIYTVKDKFHGFVKDYLIADILYTALKNKIISEDTFKIYAERECQDKTYKLVLKEIAHTAGISEKYANIENGKFILPFASKTPLSEDNLFDRYKGKLVLVDFWASWCIPCRRELPNMRELKRQYVGKNIVFLTISIDKKVSEWQKASDMEKLSAQESFLMNANDSGFVFKGYRIETIPRYLLFNKDGSIINADAPAPGSDLKQIIDKYL